MPVKIMRCKESFATEVDGNPIIVTTGMLLPASDPRVRGRESLFEEAEEAVQRWAPRTERATAEPDEKREARPTVPEKDRRELDDAGVSKSNTAGETPNVQAKLPAKNDPAKNDGPHKK